MEVRGPSSQEWVFPLDSEETLEVRGPLGDTEVVISGGAVRVIDSPCREKICIRTGAISRPGQTIACLPNQVIVVIRGEGRAGGGDQIDAFSW